MTSSAVAASYDATLREIHTESGILRYHEAGEGHPLLLLHGSGPGVTGWRNFRGILSTFAAHFRCLVLEFPGFGISDDFGTHPMRAAQSAVPMFVDALRLSTVDIIGNSMGGGVGINFAIEHPARVRRHVAIGMVPMRTMPNAELHVFPNCGHWAMIEQKQAFQDTMPAFLRRPA